MANIGSVKHRLISVNFFYEGNTVADFGFWGIYLVKKKIFKESLLGYSRKKPKGLRTFFFGKLRGIFQFFTFNFIPGNSGQNKAPPLEIMQNCVRSLGNSLLKELTDIKRCLTDPANQCLTNV